MKIKQARTYKATLPTVNVRVQRADGASGMIENNEIEFCTKKETAFILASTFVGFALNAALWLYVGHWLTVQGLL